MKKVVNHSLYNTETARKLGIDDNNLLQSDFKWQRETLYRTQSGKYFLHGEGGPMTRYAGKCSDGSIGYGEKIVPLSEEHARLWAEEHLDATDIESIFGIISDTTTRISAVIPSEIVKRMDAKCEEFHYSYSEIISMALLKYLD